MLLRIHSPILLRRKEDGAAAVVIALTLMMLVGAIGLAVDVGSWYSVERRTQLAADAAAVAAAFEIANGKTAAQAAAAALKEAQYNGFTGSGCVVNTAMSTSDTCGVYNPPTTAAFSSDTKAVEVVLREPTEAYFSGMFVSTGPEAKGQSIMSAASGAGTAYCMLALDGSASNAFFLENNATVKCGIASNSVSATGLNMENNAIIVGNAYTVGTLKMKNNAAVKGDAYAKTFSMANNAKVTGSKTSGTDEPMEDPYAAFLPSSTDLNQACADTSSSRMTCKNNCTKTVNPGRYCYGWDFQNNATVTLNSGVYVLEEQFILKNNAIIKEVAGGTGVTIILMDKGSKKLVIDVGNNATWTLSAPTSGTYAGMVLYSHKNNDSAKTQTFQNNAVLNITGAIYAPSQKIYFENNATVNQTSCTQVVARLIDIRNNGNFGTSCTGSGTGTIGKTTQIKTLM